MFLGEFQACLFVGACGMTDALVAVALREGGFPFKWPDGKFEGVNGGNSGKVFCDRLGSGN